MNISQAFNDSELNSSGKDFTDFKKYDQSRLDYAIAACVAMSVLLCFTALLGNCAILITLWRTPSLHSAANILLASLALSDLAIGLVVQPLYIILLLNKNLGTRFEIVFAILTASLCLASFFTTTTIGVDRLLALQLHLRYETVVTPVRVVGLVTSIWVFSALYSSTRLWLPKVFYKGLAPIAFTLLFVNFATYLKIYLTVRRHQVQIANLELQRQGHRGNIFWRLRKSAVNTFLVFVVLVFCYIPRALVAALKDDPFSSASEVNIITVTIIFLNSSLNPLLYCWRIGEIRTAMKHSFCC